MQAVKTLASGDCQNQSSNRTTSLPPATPPDGHRKTGRRRKPNADCSVGGTRYDDLSINHGEVGVEVSLNSDLSQEIEDGCAIVGGRRCG